MKLKTKFQDEDFKLGETVDAYVNYGAGDSIKLTAKGSKGGSNTFYYDSIKDFTDHWEDAPEETKEYWYIDCYGTAIRTLDNGNEWDERRKEIGNRFETEEKAEKAVKKLKALTRLKDKGLKIHLRSLGGYSCLEANWGVLEAGDYLDVRLLFGGEK